MVNMKIPIMLGQEPNFNGQPSCYYTLEWHKKCVNNVINGSHIISVYQIKPQKNHLQIDINIVQEPISNEAEFKYVKIFAEISSNNIPYTDHDVFASIIIEAGNIITAIAAIAPFTAITAFTGITVSSNFLLHLSYLLELLQLLQVLQLLQILQFHQSFP